MAVQYAYSRDTYCGYPPVKRSFNCSANFYIFEVDYTRSQQSNNIDGNSLFA